MDAREDAISEELLDQVLERLSFSDLHEPDLAGLAALYREWCRRVPFDNVRKLIALSGSEAGSALLPGTGAEDFFQAWLRHGTGGTCWPTANALHVLIRGCGFSSRRVAASMAETGEPTHAMTVVTIGESEYLVDSSMLTDSPVELDPARPTRTTHPVFGTEAEPVEEGWRFQFPLPFAEATMSCRTISPDGVDHAYFSERYEISRVFSPFNVNVSTRRNDGDSVISYGGAKRFVRSPAGVDESDLSGDALRAALIEELSMSEEIIHELFCTWAPLPPSGEA